MSNDQWGQQNQQGPSPWDPNQNTDDTTLRPADGSIPSATPPASQASAWEDTGWVPTAGQQPGQQQGTDPASQYSDPASQYNQQSTWGQPAAQAQPQQPYAQTQAWGQPATNWDAGQPYSAAGMPAPADGGGLGGFFKTLFDFSFTKYATPAIAKVMFVIIIIFAAFYYLALVLAGIGAAATAGDGGAFLVILALVFGWIPSMLIIIGARLQIEMVIALIRTAENTGEIKELLKERL